LNYETFLSVIPAQAGIQFYSHKLKQDGLLTSTCSV
jgi:hypothetical protein